MNSELVLSNIQVLALSYGPKLLLAILTLFIGLRVISVLSNTFLKFLERREIDPSLRPFLNSLAKVSLKILLIISVASMVGIETTSFVAVMGAAGLAVGLALQGSLANFAGGVLILIFRPFQVGDVISAQGYTAQVREIQIFCTILKTGDNRTIIIPNGILANGSLENISTEPFRRLDMIFGISYGDDIQKSKQVLLDILTNDSRVLKDPAPVVAVLALAESSVNLAVRPWAKSEDYWNLFFDLQERVKETFDREGICIPFPQRDLHLVSTVPGLVMGAPSPPPVSQPVF